MESQQHQRQQHYYASQSNVELLFSLASSKRFFFIVKMMMTIQTIRCRVLFHRASVVVTVQLQCTRYDVCGMSENISFCTLHQNALEEKKNGPFVIDTLLYDQTAQYNTPFAFMSFFFFKHQPKPINIHGSCPCKMWFGYVRCIQSQCQSSTSSHQWTSCYVCHVLLLLH